MSSETVAAPIERPRRFHWNLVPAVFVRPRQAFSRIAAQTKGMWLTPLLVLTLAALLVVAVSGPIKQAAAAAGTPELPLDYQYYTPEQQAQYQQAMAATSGPVFIYVFPALQAIGRVWIGWLLVSALLHFVLTMLGGRGSSVSAMNLVAWAALPLALRDVVRAIAMQASKSLITNTGLSGFAPSGEGGLAIFLVGLLALIDIYLIWHIVLMIVGVRAGNGLSTGKAVGGVLLAMTIVLLLQAGLAFAGTRLGGLTIVRPFF